ncbi:hypothetical protein AB0D63_43345 [Kitasatospora sp. NPDC048343]|uniref:hypothetical protein n=1 Tax=Kitasatospora sp. NPDC048343 TaxID=3154717 RepID=UPI0033C2ADEC
MRNNLRNLRIFVKVVDRLFSAKPMVFRHVDSYDPFMNLNRSGGIFSRVRAISDDASDAISDVRSSAESVKTSVDLLVVVLAGLLIVSAATLLVVSSRTPTAS